MRFGTPQSQPGKSMFRRIISRPETFAWRRWTFISMPVSSYTAQVGTLCSKKIYKYSFFFICIYRCLFFLCRLKLNCMMGFANVHLLLNWAWSRTIKKKLLKDRLNKNNRSMPKKLAKINEYSFLKQ